MRPLLMNLFSAVVIVLSTIGLIKIYESYFVFRYFFESILKITDIASATIIMLPLGYSLGSIFNSIILWIAFHRDFGSVYTKRMIRTLFEVCLSALILGFASYNSLNIFDNIFDINTFWGILSQGFFSGIIGIIFCILSLKVLKNIEIEEIWNALHKKIWGVSIVGPDTGL